MRAIAACILILMSIAAPLRAQATQGADDAAPVYREALESMTVEDPADPNSSIYNLAPLSQQGKDWVAQCAASLTLFHRAASMPRCNWGYDYLNTGQIPQSDLAAIRKLSTAAHYKALQLDAENHPRDSMAVRLDQLALAYHYGLELSSPCRLLSYAIATDALTWAAHDLNRVGAEDLAILNAAIDRLAKQIPIAPAIRMEKQASANIRRTEARRLIAERKVLPGSAQKVEASIREMETFCDKAAAASTLLPDDFDKAIEKLLAKVKPDDPMIALGVIFRDLRRASAQAEEIQLMSKTAIAVTQSGRNQLPNFKDPLNNNSPFRYRQLYTGGFELSCNYSSNGSFLTLTANDTKAPATRP